MHLSQMLTTSWLTVSIAKKAWMHEYMNFLIIKIKKKHTAIIGQRKQKYFKPLNTFFLR